MVVVVVVVVVVLVVVVVVMMVGELVVVVMVVMAVVVAVIMGMVGLVQRIIRGVCIRQPLLCVGRAPVQRVHGEPGVQVPVLRQERVLRRGVARRGARQGGEGGEAPCGPEGVAIGEGGQAVGRWRRSGMGPCGWRAGMG